jgi:hypothetical protein
MLQVLAVIHVILSIALVGLILTVVVAVLFFANTIALFHELK